MASLEVALQTDMDFLSAEKRQLPVPSTCKKTQCGSTTRSCELLTLMLYGRQDDPLRLFTRYQVWLLNMKYSGSSVAY